MDEQNNEDTLIDGGEGARAFALFIQHLSDGEAHTQLSTELHELCKRLQEQASMQGNVAKGSISLKLNLAADPKNSFVGIGYDINVVYPKPRRVPGMFWMTKGGNLTPHNPKQQLLPLRDVGASPTAAQDVTDHTGSREA